MKNAQFFFNFVVSYGIFYQLPPVNTASFWIGVAFVTVMSCGNYYFGTRWND